MRQKAQSNSELPDEHRQVDEAPDVHDHAVEELEEVQSAQGQEGEEGKGEEENRFVLLMQGV